MDYKIHTDVKYGPMELVEAGRLADECTERWWNQTLSRVNDSVVRLGVFEGEFHWHKHEREDEFFFVLEGRLFLDFEDREVALDPRRGLMVPRGVGHRTRAPERTVVLMVEAATVQPNGDRPRSGAPLEGWDSPRGVRFTHPPGNARGPRRLLACDVPHPVTSLRHPLRPQRFCCISPMEGSRWLRA